MQHRERYNKGTGAGGANTNASGLPFEKETHLCTQYRPIEQNDKYSTIRFNRTGLTLQTAEKNGVEILMASKMTKNEMDEYDRNIQADGTKLPDEFFLDQKNRVIFIVEKKKQMVNGSNSEIIQTGVFKEFHYKERYPNYTVIYIYILSNFFFEHESCIPVFKYLDNHNIAYFFENEKHYKENIEDFMNYICSNRKHYNRETVSTLISKAYRLFSSTIIQRHNLMRAIESNHNILLNLPRQPKKEYQWILYIYEVLSTFKNIEKETFFQLFYEYEAKKRKYILDYPKRHWGKKDSKTLENDFKIYMQRSHQELLQLF